MSAASHGGELRGAREDDEVFEGAKPRLQVRRNHSRSMKSRSFSLAARSRACRSNVPSSCTARRAGTSPRHSGRSRCSTCGSRSGRCHYRWSGSSGRRRCGGKGTGSASTPAAAQSVVYFDFDSSDLKPESQVVVAAWAKYLTANPTAKAQLQGNTDERGTREYNLALGERRSAAVSAALQSAGVAASQVELTSNGEEKPVALGHDEASWSQNRRVEIVGQ